MSNMSEKIFYEVTNYDDTITPIKAERFNEKSVWVNGLRKARVSSWKRLYETEEAAQAAIIARYEGKVKSLQDRLKELPLEIRNAEEKLLRIKKSFE